MADIRPAVTPPDLARARELVLACEREMETACCAEGVAFEANELGRVYGPPAGRLLLAFAGEEAVGVAAVRPLGDGDAELRRLYVVPEHRGEGTGGALAVRALAETRTVGHRVLRAEVVPARMPAAAALLAALGFEESPPYVRRPLAGAVYLAFPLR